MGGNDWTANALAGTDTTSCNALPACTKFKKTCAAKAGWGFWEDTELTVTITGSTPSKHAAYVQLRCFPPSCEGMEFGSSEHAYELKAGTTGPTKTNPAKRLNQDRPAPDISPRSS